jgi:hypothetical protein
MTTRAPLSLHESIVEKHHTRSRSGEPVGDKVIAALASAVRQGREAAEALAHAADAMMRDGTTTEAARRLAVRQRALASAERMAALIDAARDAALAEIQRLEKDTSSPAVVSPHSAEIRARLVSLSPDARNAALAAALKDGDDAVLAAVLKDDVPSLLTGFSPTELAMKRHAYRQARHPVEVDRIARLAKAVKATEIAGEAAMAFLTGIADDPAAAVAAAHQKAAQAAAAALDERAA